MPEKGSSSGGYKYTGSGTNSQVRELVDRVYLARELTASRQGNHYCSRDYGSFGSRYRYSNSCVVLFCATGSWRDMDCFYSNGSYYYNNPNGSTYYNSGSGYSQYTSPSGDTHKSYSSSK